MEKKRLPSRILALLLCVMMVLSMLPVAALADSTEETEGTEETLAVTEPTTTVETTEATEAPDITPATTAPTETETLPPETTEETLPEETEVPETTPETVPETTPETVPEDKSRGVEGEETLAVPVVIYQPGERTSETDATPCTTEYTTEQNPGDIWFQFSTTDTEVEFRYQVYYTTGDSTDEVEATGVTVTEESCVESEDGLLVSCSLQWPETVTYDAGEYAFFVKITVSCPDAPELLEVTIQTESVTLTITEPLSPWEGSGTAADPYVIDSMEKLEELRKQNADGNTFSGVTFALEGRLELPTDWVPIGTASTRFCGTLDGDAGNTGTCATIVVAKGGKPLLGYVKDAAVRNLNIYGEQIDGYGLVDNFVGVGLSGSAIVIDKVTILSGSKILKSGFLGGYTTTNPFAGVSAGYVATIRNCTVENGVVIGYNKDQTMIGSFAGRMQGTVENCVSYATVYGVNYVGGIIGTRDNALGTCKVTGCTFGGSVIASGEHAGGIQGGGYENSTAPNGIRATLTNNTVTGSISGKDKVGGILGGDTYVAQAWNAYSIRSNHFSGTVSATGSYIGGIIGFYDSLNKFDDIGDNTYTATCGAERGIGFVKYLDTNCENPTVPEETIAFNTETGTDACPKVTGCVWRKAYNRTDDPLGADAETLCKKVGTAQPVTPTCYELKVSGSYKTTYTVGEDLDLTGIVLTAKWTEGKEDTTVSLSDVKVSGYDKNKEGSQTVILTYQNVKAEITVTCKPKSNKITVSVSILGDSKHGSGSGPHGLALGGLTTWASGSMEATTSETVWDVLSRLASQKGLSIQASYSSKYNSYYIEGVNGLAEFDNGSNSGWMYTVNGSHPEVGVSARYVKNGDSIVLHYTDDFNYEEGGIYYGQSSDSGSGNSDKVSNVISLIKKIGTVTKNSGTAIQKAWDAYNALTAAEKEKVTNFATLQKATEEWNQLMAEEVVALIKKIPSTVTEDSKKEIEAARKAYDALTEDQKALVTNYKVLTDAETAYAKLVATEEDRQAAQKVMDLIAAAQTQEEIAAARKAYDALTELQKKLVENYDLLVAAESGVANFASMGKVAEAYRVTGDYMTNLGAPSVGTIGGEWMVIGLARSGREVPGAEEYYQSVVDYVRENIDENGRLHKAKSTNNSRLILALTAIGKDVTDVDGHDLLQGLNSMDFVKKQGNNGPIWALLALDSGNYPEPEGDVTRKALIDEILSVQTSDGGWALSGDEADSDMTGMALQALAPYYQKNAAVQQAVDKAIDRLSKLQNEDGGYGTFSGNGKVATSESTAQVIVALTALGIDPDTDARFIKNGNSAVDALLGYFVTGGGFRHIADGELDGMATEQGYYALTAYCRFLEGKTSLYNMTDVIDMGGNTEIQETLPETVEPETVEKEEQKESFSWVMVVLVLVLGIGIGMGGTLAVVLVVPKLKKNG